MSIIKHERQHCWSEALDVHKSRISGKNEKNIKKFDTESLANQQKIIKAAEEKGREWNNNEIFSYLSREFICVKILAGGAEILEHNDIEKEAKEWLRTQYFFGGDNSSIEKFGDNRNDFLNEYLYYKNQDKIYEFYNLFLEEFRKIKNEVLEKYNQHIKENNIPDFYGKEDRECEDLRIKIINRLNQEKLI